MPASLRIDHIVLANRVAKPSKFTVNAPVTPVMLASPSPEQLCRPGG